PAIGGGAGTSMAAPHAAGAAALLLSKMPTLSPDDVAGKLTNAARPFPAGLYCAQNPGLCGAGLLDARAALDLLDGGGPSLSVSHPSLITGGQTASLIATATPSSGGSTSFTWQWTQIAGTPVTLMGANTAVASFVGPNPGGSHTIKVTVVDGNGYSASQTFAVRTNNPPVMNPVAPKSVAQGGSLYFTVSATDPENDPLVYVAVTNPPSGASFSAATGAFSWPNVGVAPGNYGFKVMAYDGTVDSAQLTIDITVTAGTSPPPTGGGGGSQFFEQLLSWLLAMLAALWNALGGN
ncbi:MAG: S8 family serine peptidase, partial [Chromatiales bacterium]|nr:S8 family serine peptidase [Chromatiales bacterium]